MKLTSILRTLAFTAIALSGQAQNAGLHQIQTVYLLPMGNGFDQYLANQLTRLGPYQVVTDAQQADALFTDRLGEAFELRLNELFPVPVDAPKDADKKETESKDDKAAVQPSSFSRAKGTLFLVDRKSRRVVWSVFETPKYISPEALNNTAERVVKELKRSLGPK